MPVQGLRFNLFGKFAFQVPGEGSRPIDPTKVQELLAYLLVYRHRPHPREYLAEMLWQASSTAQAKKYLRQTLWQMQSVLPMSELGPLVQIEPDWVCINPASEYWLDVAEFEAAFGHAQGTPGHELTGEVAAILEGAVALYQGDLLEGCYSDWCLYERERLQNMWLAILDKLMSYCESKADYEAGLSYGMQVLRQDRARERTHRRLIRMAYLSGDRTGALRQYERCVTALDEELDVRPSRRTEQLHRRILSDALEPGDPSFTGESHPALALISQRLEQLRSVLTQLHEHVREDLDALDQALIDPE